MGIISQLFNTRASGSYRPSDPALADLWGGRSSSSNQHVTPDTALRTSAVYACVTVLSQTLAMLPKQVLGAGADGSKIPQPDHRLTKQLRHRPNRWQSAFEFYEMMEGHRLLRGNAYAKIVFNPGRQQNELVPMHPDYVWPFVITPEGITYYLYDTSPCPPEGSALWYQHFPQNGNSEILAASEVLHVRAYSINGIVGISAIRWAAFQAVGLAMATEEHGAKLFANGAQVAKVFTHPGKLKQDTIDRLEERIASKFGGSANAAKSMILTDGLTIEKVGMTADESQFLETRKFQVEDIARIFNVPLIMIGAGDKAPTYASAENFFMSFKIHTMQPNIERWEAALERALLYPSELGRIEIDFDMDSMMRGDAVARSTYLKNRFEIASMTPDEVRKYEGENPTNTTEGGRLYLQSGMMPASMAGAQPVNLNGQQGGKRDGSST